MPPEAAGTRALCQASDQPQAMVCSAHCYGYQPVCEPRIHLDKRQIHRIRLDLTIEALQLLSLPRRRVEDLIGPLLLFGNSDRVRSPQTLSEIVECLDHVPLSAAITVVV